MSTSMELSVAAGPLQGQTAPERVLLNWPPGDATMSRMIQAFIINMRRQGGVLIVVPEE